MAFNGFYEHKKVLVTGDTGFKGAWLAYWLKHLGAEIYGLAREPNTHPSLFEILALRNEISHTTLDVRDAESVKTYVCDIRPDIVFHLAAQSLVRLSYEIPIETIQTNVIGSANLLSALGAAGYSDSNPCAVVVVTSDKCYENREVCEAYREIDPMGGYDIYSASKGAAELIVASWRRAFFTRHDGLAPAILLATCRAGNVIGGGDWAPERLAVDCFKALGRGESIAVRNPCSIRPWQHVLEPLSGYLQIGALLAAHREQHEIYCSGWNYGPGRQSERTVAELCDCIIKHWGSGSWTHAGEADARHEAHFLKLSINKAWYYMGWEPVWDFEKTVAETAAWYRMGHECAYDSDVMTKKTEEQIELYMQDAASKSLRWMESR